MGSQELKTKESKISIYDLIENEDINEEEIEQLDPKDINYE